jgi:hypothetical protein
MLERINPRKFLTYNLILIAILLAGNITGIIFKFGFNHDYVYGLVPLFNFDTETNIPTIYSACALLFSSFLLFTIGHKNKLTSTPYVAWLALALIFVFLAIDETFIIHENLIVPVRESLGTSGLFFYAWVIPYGIGLLFFLLIFSKFLITLPKKSLIYFVASGAVFVTGAIGFELIGGQHAEIHGRENVAYAMITTTEELLEMVGIAFFIYSLFHHIQHYTPQIKE